MHPTDMTVSLAFRSCCGFVVLPIGTTASLAFRLCCSLAVRPIGMTANWPIYSEIYDGPVQRFATSSVTLSVTCLGRCLQDDEDGAYVLNVVVDREWRRRGLGREIMTAAIRAATVRRAQRIYTEVDTDNMVRFALRFAQ